MKKHKKLSIIKKAILIIIALLIIMGAGSIYYVSDYYHAEESSINIMHEKNDHITIVKNGSREIDFIPDNIVAGLIFYPGGKVQYESYAPLMKKLAERGILAILLKMPCNLAVLDQDAAEGIEKEWPEVKRWYMAGHSLGGVMAASYLEKHQAEYEGLVLLAAYSSVDLSNSNLRVLSIYGENDQVLNLESYKENLRYLPNDFQEIVIKGANHAQFGDYGRQKGDGVASISSEQQVEETVNAISNWIR